MMFAVFVIGMSLSQQSTTINVQQHESEAIQKNA